MKHPLAFLALMLLMSAGNCYAQKDTIYFLNGSLLVGELKKIKMGVVTFDPDDANDITVQSRKIRSIHASSEIFRVESIRDKVVFGFIRPDTTANMIRVVFGETIFPIALEEVSNLYPFSKKFARRFSGSAGLGYSYSRSSAFGRLNADGSLNYLSRKHELRATFSGIYSQTDSGFTRDREDLGLKDNIYFSHSSFATIFLQYQRNLELGLARRFQEGVGIGNKFITTRSIYAWARGGLVFNQEKSTEGNTSGLLTEIFAQLQFNLFKFTKPEINLNWTQTAYAGLTEKGRIRTDGETNLSWEIIDDLKLNINFYSSYDSKPPVEGSNLDYGIVFGLKYTF